jgi:hypothetical protein
MEPQMYSSVRILRDDPTQQVRAGDEGALVDWIDHPAGGERGAIIELYGGREDPVVTVPASWIEAIQEASGAMPDAASGDSGARKTKRAG